MIRAFKSQWNLMPHFYNESAWVGFFGCLTGGAATFYISWFLSFYFGIEADVPLHNYDQTVVISFFACCIIELILCLYVFCSLSCFVYYGLKYTNSDLSKEELINIAFKGLYPQRWQKRN
ncbi:hypothetical protein WH43_18355 [Rheinheimera sp. KL1]|uniref:hypothetical protein n=1 Tax=Rheinheimera sp. KL1 TaxID=1635005 RepID=UPI0006A99117|nr:hypothetical protein [Rheinheimera sp. KL1]KOO56757.1 hypothetical protein WH43_18355 [Rheinheimera sp. KL1]